MKKGKKRSLALMLALSMVLSLFTGVTANAGWYNPDDDWDNGNEVQFGLFANRSWWGEYWEGEEPNQVRKEGWLVEGDMPFSSEDVNISNMWENTNVDIREVDGTYNQAFYFSYIPYTRNENGGITVAANVKPEVVKDSSKLVISYLGTELEGSDNDARWAKDTRTDATDAHLEAVGDDGLFKICDAEPGYYIISYGDLEASKWGDFKNSDAAVGLYVYKYTGLAVREAWYDENEDNWSVNDDQNYDSNLGSDLWYKEFSLTNVNDGVEGDISLDDVELTYYGEESELPTHDDGNTVDPRWTYGEDQEGNGGKFVVHKETSATLTADSKSGLIKFTPDKPGIYLISKKGITDEVTDANREIREQAVSINVGNGSAAFYNEAGTLSHANLLTTVWDNCYNPSFVAGQEKPITAYFYSPVNYDEEGNPEDTFEVCNIDYNDNKCEVKWVKESDDSEAVLSIPDDIKDIFSMEPVENMTGWYKVTVTGIEGYFNSQFVSNYDGRREAYLNIGYYENNQYFIKRLHESNYQYPDGWGGYYGQVTEPYIFKLYKSGDDGLNEVSSADMKKFSIYRYWELGFTNENGEFNYFDDFIEREGYYDKTQEKWIENKDEYVYYPDSTNPIAVLGILSKNDSDIGCAATYGEASNNGYMEINTSEEGRYALYDGVNIVKFELNCPGIGLYSASYRGVNENNENDSDIVDDLVLEDKVYQGRSKSAYVLTWVGDDDDGWAPDVSTMEAFATSNIDWDKNTFDEFEGYVELDKEKPVKDSDSNIIGYPITITDKVEESFDLYMIATRNQAKGEADNGMSSDDRFERNAVYMEYIPLKELNIKTEPKVTYYEDAVFDATDLVVEAVYEDGEKFTLDAEDYDIAIGEKKVDDKLAATDTKVTISYLGKTVDLTITVNEKEPVDLSGAAWSYKEAFTADGTEKKVEISGLPDTVNVEYKNNKKTEVGQYTAEATITLKDDKSYKLAADIPDTLKSLTWEIKENPKTVADKKAAADVTATLNALPATVAVTDEEKITAARKAYDALTADQKALVSDDTLKKLKDAEDALASAKKTADDEASKKAADAVVTAINALPATVAVTDEAAITAARKAYDALTADQKALVSADTLKKLTDSETALTTAKKAAEDAAAALEAAKNIATTKITLAKNNKSKKIAVKLKSVSGATGYQVRYSLKSSMKSSKVKKLTKTSVTLSKLKKGKTYYIQARAYATYNGETYHSKWTAKKKVKVKK